MLFLGHFFRIRNIGTSNFPFISCRSSDFPAFCRHTCILCSSTLATPCTGSQEIQTTDACKLLLHLHPTTLATIDVKKRANQTAPNKYWIKNGCTEEESS